jgi:hypothetical protein
MDSSRIGDDTFMLGLGSLVVTVPLVLVGAVYALAGRDIHHFAIRATGFLVGFGGFAVGWFGPVLLRTWSEGDPGQLAGLFVFGVLATLLAGVVIAQVAWFVYRFSIELPDSRCSRPWTDGSI